MALNDVSLPIPFFVRLADLSRPADQQAVVDLLDMYAREPMGQGTPLADDVRERLLPGLQAQPGCRVFVAWNGERPLGLAMCFTGFSTFRARPLLNIHDLAVCPEARGAGVGAALLAAVENEARQLGCCKITLEVRADNPARRLYERHGFAAGSTSESAQFFMTRFLE